MRNLICIIVIVFVTSCAAVTGVEPVSASDHNLVKELVIKDIKIGEGAEATIPRRVHVHYTGWLYDALSKDNKGTKFDSSHDRGKSFTFVVGAREVIAGWDQGVAGMKVGGKRRLVIPPHLGYGRRGAGRQIPPNSTLVFDVELLRVE